MKIECPFCRRSYEIGECPIGNEPECGVRRGNSAANEAARPARTESLSMRHGAAVGAWICLTLGITLNAVGVFALSVSLPLYLAAFILSIVHMSRRRLGSGLASLILTVLLPPIIILVNGGIQGSRPEHGTDAPAFPRGQAADHDGRMSRRKETRTGDITNLAATKEISGLCGIRFGSFFARNSSPKNRQLNDGETMYAVNPPKRFMGFTDYYVLTTPASEKVYSIRMQWNCAKRTQARAAFKRVAAELEKLYNVKGKRENTFDPEMTFRFDNGRLVLRVDNGFGKSTLEILGYSDEFEYLKKGEQRKPL